WLFEFLIDLAGLIIVWATKILARMSWWLLRKAATHPELVTGVVVEDMAPDQRGRTVDAWRGYFDSWPVPFQSLAHVRAFFGDGGDYFAECVEEREDGYHLIADLERLYPIAAEWGEREYWSYVEKVRCPMLVLEAEHSAMPAGQMSQMPLRAPADPGHPPVLRHRRLRPARSRRQHRPPVLHGPVRTGHPAEGVRHVPDHRGGRPGLPGRRQGG
ncbi:hypothetical protein ACFQ1S_40820, partial [Kibdelosporangium lantanae]